MTGEAAGRVGGTEPLIALEHLRLSLRGRGASLFSRRAAQILDDVSVTIGHREILGIVGESGSGKTTLGKAMLRLYRPKGRILYRGKDLAGLSERQLRPFRAELQMIFQDPLSSFNPRYRIGDSIALPLLLHRHASRHEVRGAVTSLLKQVGLNAGHAERFPHELSGGQLQRVAIARVLGLAPKLIVADEAVSKLDVSVRAQILNLIKRVNRESGIAFVFITHDLTVARFLCDRIAVMYAGRIIEIGETSRIFAKPQHPYTVSLINARREPWLAAEADDAMLGATVAAHACSFAPRCPRREPHCLEERPSLEEREGHRVACFHPSVEFADADTPRLEAAGQA
ncbi:MAG: ABC transporter ATP-binding protein [Hyphomicrobiales bacterium]